MLAKKKAPITRFLEKVEITSRFGGCWLWKGNLSGNGRGGGYGRFSICGRTVAAHRFAYEFYNKCKIKKGYHIDHLCRNRNCVNPKHLEMVTPSTNQKRKWKAIKDDST